jgi:hypothetical protein
METTPLSMRFTEWRPAVTSEPPTLIKLSEVPAYVEARYGLTISRQTAYNWAREGKRGTKLRTIKRAGVPVTTKGWVDDFITGVN